jgi:hypothetical protein
MHAMGTIFIFIYMLKLYSYILNGICLFVSFLFMSYKSKVSMCFCLVW